MASKYECLSEQGTQSGLWIQIDMDWSIDSITHMPAIKSVCVALVTFLVFSFSG